MDLLPLDWNICFDFPPNPVPKETERINFGDFKECYWGLKFDEVLRDVHFGRVELQPLPVPRPRAEATESADNLAAGRKASWTHLPAAALQD